VIVIDGPPDALLPRLRDTDLAQLSGLTLYQVQRLVELAAGTAAVRLAALAQALGQGAAKKPAVQGEASDLGAEVSLGSGKLGAMGVIAHLETFYTLYIYTIQELNAECDYKMNANLLLERWRIGKRIESGGYLGNKFTVAESLNRTL
jgi:hypothetical protein